MGKQDSLVKKEKKRKKKNIFRMGNFPLFQKEPAKQFQIVALARSFLSETGFFDRKREKTEEKKQKEKNIFRMANFPLFQKETGFFDRKKEKKEKKKTYFAWPISRCFKRKQDSLIEKKKKKKRKKHISHGQFPAVSKGNRIL